MAMFGAFAAAGALSGLGQGMMHQSSLQEALDTNYKVQQQQLDYAKQLDAAKEQTKTAGKLAEINAKKDPNNDPVTKEYQAMVSAAQTPINGAQPVPGVPAQMGGQTQQPAPQQATTPQPQAQDSQAIQPRTAAIQPQPQAAPQPAGGPMASPQGGPVPIGNEQAPQTPPEAGNIPPTAPAANIAGQADKAHAMQTQDPFDMAAANLATGPNGSFGQSIHDMFMDSHAMYPNLTPEALAAGVKDYAQGNWDDRQSWNKHMATLNDSALKNAKSTVDTTQWGSEDKASVTAMQREGLLGDAEKLKPLTAGQTKDNDTLVQQAYQLKTAATQGIGTFERIVQDTSKINPGPGAETAAYIKSAWAQMTGTQRSQALTTFFEGQKETVNALNAQINTMRQAGGRFVVGANVLKMEEKGIPDITKMTPEASLALAQGYINNYKQMIGQADAIMTTPEQISPVKRIQFANSYAEKNPTFGPDGQTPNSSWQEFKDWRDNGTKSGITGASNRAQATANSSGALANAKQGGPGSVPNDPNIAVIQQGLPAGAKVTRIK